MQLRTIGKTGLKVTAMSYGTWQTFGESVNVAEAEEIVKTAWESGIRTFDGAEAYAMGKADEMMGNVLKKMGWSREDYVLTGKCIRNQAGDDMHHGISRKRLRSCCENTLRNYHTDYLDLFFCHRPDGNTPPEEIVISMNALIQQGKILYWGTSEFDPMTLERMWQFASKNGMEGPVVEQTGYNLLGRDRMENVLVPLFEKWGMGSTVYSPIAAGQLSGKYNDGIPEGTRLADHEWLRNQLTDERIGQLKAIQGIADDLGVSMAELAYAWTLKNPNVSTCIMGARKPEQVSRNVRALDVVEKLTPEVMEKLDAVCG
ncbi:MAG: aldo/keto reductase [Opitutales bacterium]